MMCMCELTLDFGDREFGDRFSMFSCVHEIEIARKKFGVCQSDRTLFASSTLSLLRLWILESIDPSITLPKTKNLLFIFSF